MIEFKTIILFIVTAIAEIIGGIKRGRELRQMEVRLKKYPPHFVCKSRDSVKPCSMSFAFTLSFSGTNFCSPESGHRSLFQ